jgi:hypothetical protein
VHNTTNVNRAFGYDFPAIFYGAVVELKIGILSSDTPGNRSSIL